LYGTIYFGRMTLKSVSEARRFIVAFNGFYSGYRAFMQDAQIWRVLPEEVEKVLVEPYINGKWINFNSNTGYENHRYEFAGGLSHFSYHFTHGEKLLCDLQGTTYTYRCGLCPPAVEAYLFTDPVIHSQKKGGFGPLDLGQNGIDNFFGYHKCGRFCKPGWRKPPNSRKIFTAERGSAMVKAGGQLVGTKIIEHLPEICEGDSDYDSDVYGG